MSTKKYVSLDKLSVFLNNLKNTFAFKNHEHPIDSELSDTSENPVQNKVVNAEFDAIAEGMGALEAAIDDNQDAIDALQTVAADKAPKVHSHAISDIEDFEEITSTEIQELFN